MIQSGEERERREKARDNHVRPRPFTRTAQRERRQVHPEGRGNLDSPRPMPYQFGPSMTTFTTSAAASRPRRKLARRKTTSNANIAPTAMPAASR